MGINQQLSMMEYKLEGDAIVGYESGKQVFYLWISNPVSRSKYILQLHDSGELLQ